MFENFKDTITDLAFSAVNYAENALSTSSGKEKKHAAITFLVNKLMLPPYLKPLIVLCFSGFIDTAVEKAVEYMNQVKNED